MLCRFNGIEVPCEKEIINAATQEGERGRGENKQKQDQAVEVGYLLSPPQRVLRGSRLGCAKNGLGMTFLCT
jgi:hypothetical protein